MTDTSTENLSEKFLKKSWRDLGACDGHSKRTLRQPFGEFLFLDDGRFKLL